MTLKLKVTSWCLRDFCYLCLYLSYRIEFFFCFVRFLIRSRNLFQLLPFAWPSRVTLKLKVMSWFTLLLLSLLVFVLPRWMFCCFLSFFRSRKSFHLLPITWPLRVTLKLKVTSWSTWLLLVHDVTFRFKVTRKGHAIGNSRNEFRDLKTLRNNEKIIAVGRIQAEITKVT